ncbi:WxcM-like domain-containing protein [Vibrio nigripulchritudo]|uniref:WxcM-like domain-containing protein n=1 Tax=Vibrio nigripulchritudo TaxID=28173 RepID=UPI0005FA4BB4|nr:WxcM-like domain-containing protein [Vibrio nigripulchritudo]KJY79069.1 hypothetical protein TW74_10285 [Vibrio nigripulchritudo]
MDKLECSQQPVLTRPKVIKNPKGDIYHVLKKSEPDFRGFGEAYFTTINGGEIKGWKKHTLMHMNLVVISGCVSFYIYDEITDKTDSFKLAEDEYCRLSIPPGFWVAFQGNKNITNIILNVASIEHDPKEAINCDITTYPLGKNT